MKKTVATIIADQKAAEYFCLLTPVQAKKVLFAMSRLEGNQRLGDSNVAEVRKIAEFYDGVITSHYAKELATYLASEYAKKTPRVLLTKKQVEEYTHAKYRKLYDALGIYGFDYVITALAQGKAYVANPENGIDEKNMLSALRWDERREGENPVISNNRHRRKGLQLVGLGDMVDVLMPYTYIIASVYELITPGTHIVSDMANMTEQEEVAAECTPVTVRDMKIHFIENAHIILDFYGTIKPKVPEGFFEEELVEGSTTYLLAQRGLVKDSKAVLQYVEQNKLYTACLEKLHEIFSDEEMTTIQEHKEVIRELIKNSW